jgi:AAA domain, putative AbiEii toxin, Type IV TA system
MIKEVVLRRFKRFEEERFDLSGHVILAGPNNCGKTTVLQAIAAWALALRYWRNQQEQRSVAEKKPAKDFFYQPGGYYTWVPISRPAFAAVPLRSFEMLWKDRNYHDAVEIEVTGRAGWKIAAEFKADSSEQIYVRPRKAPGIAEVLLSLNLDVVYVATVGGLSTRELKLDPDAIETLLGEQKPGEVIRNLLLQASRAATWERLTGAVQRLFGVELLVPQSLGGQIVCEYRRAEGQPSFDLLNSGSGMQQVVMLLACLFWRKGAVVLVDEPDAHLHVFLQDTIFYELSKAAAETNSQLVIATHSEVIFNSAEPTQICVMMGKPRRLSSAEDVKKLQQAVAVLQQSDIVAALATPGILYIEGYTDLNPLREWARILKHPLSDYLSRTPFWRAKQPPGRPDASEVPVRTHFDALKLVEGQITGVWLIDADGKAQNIKPSGEPERGKLNRIAWRRYETESYLVHPASLARFIDSHSGKGGAEAVRNFLSAQFDAFAGAGLGRQIADAFIANPGQPSQLVQTYLASTKARTQVLAGILQEGGVHGMDYTRFDEIAAVMLPEEVHPEVREKLDFIQKAFGL